LCLAIFLAGLLSTAYNAASRRKCMRKIKWALLLVLISLAVSINLAGCLFNFLSPPSWIQGSWSDSHGRFEFTSNDVIYTNFDSGNTYDERLLGYTDSSTLTTYTITSSTGSDLFTKANGSYITWELVGEGLGASNLYKD
jgi:hypothetical protein